MMKRYLFYFCLLAVLTVFSCKKETQFQSAVPTRDYFPATIGDYVVYDVDSTIWSSFNDSIAQRHYQMRYTLTDTFRDAAGFLSYVMDVNIRSTDTGAWANSDVYTLTPTQNGLDLIMNNLRFQKLAFPIVNGTSWNGNSQIATNDQDLSYYAGWNYVYSNLGQSYNNGRVAFDNSVVVNEVNDSVNNPELIPAAYATRTYSKEVYGYKVGMIYREFTHWVYDPNAPVQSGGIPFRNGFSVVMRATDHN